MYIEFTLPTGAGGMSANYVHWEIRKNLQEWSEKYQIPFQSKVEKLKVKVTFEDERNYSVFSMTWNPTANHLNSWIKNFKFIEPMRRPS